MRFWIVWANCRRRCAPRIPPEKASIDRSLGHENVSVGRHAQSDQSITSEAVRLAISPPTIAHAPRSRNASVRATAAANSVDAMTRISSDRKFIARMRSAFGTEESDAITKHAENAENSGWSCGSSKMSASGTESAIPTRQNVTPSATEAQKTVERSTSVISRRWISAAPRPRSDRTGTNNTNASTRLATPKSDGTSTRASTTSSTIRVTCVTASAVIFHAIPRTAARLRFVGSGWLIDHRL